MSTTNQKKPEQTSDYLKKLERANLNQNSPEATQTNSEYLQQRQQEREQARNAPTLEDYQNQADQTHSDSRNATGPRKVIGQSDAKTRQLKMQRVTATKGYMAASMGAGYAKQLSGLGISDGILGGYQGGMKSISNVNRVSRSLDRQTHAGDLGIAGKTKGATSAINNAMRLTYSANLLKGIATAPLGGSIAPTSSMKGSMMRGVNAITGSAPAAGGGMLANMTSPGALLTGGLAATGMVSGMTTNKKMRKLMVTKKTPGELERKYAKANNLEGFYKALREQSQITPQQQLQYILLSYIEAHTSVLPKLLSLSMLENDQKKKSGKQLSGNYSKKTGISDDPEMKKYDSIFKTLENTINTMVTKYDPISQLTSFILTGSSPKKILDDINDAKGLSKKELAQKDQQASRLGISTDQLRLLSINSASLITGLQSYDAKMLALASASYDMNRLIAQESTTIRKHGLGIDHNSFNKPIKKTGLFGKLENVIQMIPGLSAGYNIIKDTLLLPKKGSEFVKGLFKGGMDKIFGKDFIRLQNQKEIDKELGIDKTAQVKATEYTAVGLPTHMEKIRTLSAQQLDVQYNIFEVLKNQYDLTHQQLTGNKSEFKYTQKMDDDVLQERTWDSFEQKMLNGDALEKAVEKRQKMRTLKRESEFKKSLMGKMSLMMTDQDHFITPIEQRMEQIFTPLNAIAKKFSGTRDIDGQAPFVISAQQKKEEKDRDIRSNIQGDSNVRDISLDVERKRDIPDIAGNTAASSLALAGGIAALASGPLGLLLAGGGIATKMLMGKNRDKKLDAAEESELGKAAIDGREITSLQDEINKRSNLVDKTPTLGLQQSNQSIISLIDKDKIIPDKIGFLHDMIEEKFGKLINFFTTPIAVESSSVVSRLDNIVQLFVDPVKTGLESITNKLGEELKVNVISNVFSDYKLKIKKENQSNVVPIGSKKPSIVSGMTEGYSEIKAAANGGKLASKTLVGENGPEYIEDGFVYTAKQAKSKFGLDLYNLASNPSITKLAEGGKLPENNTSADSYNVLTQIRGSLFRLRKGATRILSFLKTKKSAEAKQPENNVVDIASKMKEDKEEKKHLEEVARQDLLISNGTETIELLREIDENTEPTDKKDGMLGKILGIIGTTLTSMLGGWVPLLALGGSVAAFFGTDGKVGTKAIAGFVGSFLNKIFMKVGDIFNKSAPDLIADVFEKSYNMFKTPIEKIVKPIYSTLSKLTSTVFKNTVGKFSDNFLKFWPEYIGKIPVKPDLSILKPIIDAPIKLFKTAVEKLSPKISNFFISKMSGLSIKNISKTITKIPVLGSFLKDMGSKLMEKMGFKALQKLGVKGVGKALGKAVPFLGLIFGGYFAVKRLLKNDVVGALGELGSGLASIFPGVGTAISLGLDVWLAVRDAKREKAGVGEDGSLKVESVGGSFLKGMGKFGPKLLGIFGKGGLKSFAKKIPFLGAPIGLYFAYQRFMDGDYLGAFGELASGLTSLVPGIGTAVGIGIDVLLMMRDSSKNAKEQTTKDKNFKPGMFAKLSDYVLGKFTAVSDWLMGTIYSMPIFGGIIKNFITGTKSEFDEVSERLKIDELNSTDGKLNFWEKISSIGSSIGRIVVRGVPFVGGLLESAIFGKKNIAQELQKSMKTAGMETPDMAGMNIGQSNVFKEVKVALTKTASDSIRSIRFIGPMFAKLVDGTIPDISSEIDKLKLSEKLESPKFKFVEMLSSIRSSIANWIADTFTMFGIGENIASMIDPKFKKNLKTTKINSLISSLQTNATSKELVNSLADQDIVNKNMVGSSNITDWETVSLLPANQLQKILNYNDWDDETTRKLNELIYKKTQKDNTKIISTPPVVVKKETVAPQLPNYDFTKDEYNISGFDKGTDKLLPGLSIVGEGDGNKISPTAEFILTDDNKSTVIDRITSQKAIKEYGLTGKDLKHNNSSMIAAAFDKGGVLKSKPNPGGGMSSLPKTKQSFDGNKFFTAFKSKLAGLIGKKRENGIGEASKIFSGREGDEIEPDPSNLSKSIQDVVKNHVKVSEGGRNHRYIDPLGYDTWGYGSLSNAEDKKKYSFEPNSISDYDINAEFDKDFRHHKMLASKIPEYGGLSDVRKGALIDLVFNMGLGGVKKFTGTLGKLSSGDFKGAASNLLDSKYAKQVGSRANRIAKVIETNDPSYFNSNKPEITAKHGAITGGGMFSVSLHPEEFKFDLEENKIGYTGEGTSPIRDMIGPNKTAIVGKEKVKSVFADLIAQVNEQVSKKLDMKRTDISSLASKTKEFEKYQRDNIEELKKEETKKATVPAQAPIIVNKTQPIVMPEQSNRQDTEGRFTDVDDTLDRLIGNLFSASAGSLMTAITDFTLSNTAYI